MDDVEREVVEAGGAPDGDEQEEGRAEGGVFEQDRGAGEEQAEEEEEAFGVDEARVGEVGHVARIARGNGREISIGVQGQFPWKLPR